MQVKFDGNGQLSFEAPQQCWQGDDKMQRAKFAGQVMMIVVDQAGIANMHYLGFQTGGFKTIEDAKKVAPEFARKVLGRLAELISD